MIKITKLKCLRCKHSWVPRIQDIRICPSCKSPYWNKSKKTKVKKLVAVAALFFVSANVFAAEIPQQLAVRAIVGEAAGQSYQEKIAIGEAIRNRGTLRGVYGVNAKHNETEPEWVWKQSREAWIASANTNVTKGATHWEGVSFKKPYWADSMVETARIGETVFYREKTKGE